MKKPLLLSLIFILAVPIFALDSLEVQKEEIKDIAKTFKTDIDKRSGRIKPVPKIKIQAPKTRAGAVKAAKKPQEAKAYEPVIYDYSHKTVWGEFKINVIEYPDKNYFKFGFESKFPVQSVEVIDNTPNKKSTLYQKNLNDIKKYSDQVNFAYKPVYILILKADINGEIQPNIIPLYKETQVKYK
jgi:hypothetical protein